MWPNIIACYMQKNYINIIILMTSSTSVLSVLTDFSIDAPPSLKPAKKYSDISGLPVSNINILKIQ